MNTSFKTSYFMLMFLIGSSLIVGCQTSPIIEFSRINLGQDKSDVIEYAGGPSWSDRRNGLDRWTYIIFQDGVRLERQVHFFDGIVAYVGDPVEPFISAEEQDRINSAKNLTLDRMDRLSSNSTTPSQSSRSTKNPSSSTELPSSDIKNNSSLSNQSQ